MKSIYNNLLKKGWILIGSTLYHPDNVPKGYSAPKKNRSKIIRSCDEKDTRNLKNKEEKHEFITYIRLFLNIDVWPEYYFTNERKFRIDFAIPDHKIAIEVDGGVWMKKSGHNTGQGIIRDQEKTSLLSAYGWSVIRVIPKNLITEETLRLIEMCIKNKSH